MPFEVADALFPFLRVRIPIPMPFFMALLVLVPFGWVSMRLSGEGHRRTASTIFVIGIVLAVVAAREARAAGYPYWPYGDPEPPQTTENPSTNEFIRSTNEQYREYPIEITRTGDEYETRRSPLNVSNRLMPQCTSSNAPFGHDGVFQECVENPLIHTDELLFNSDKHHFICKP